jgi:DNA modification methylase
MIQWVYPTHLGGFPLRKGSRTWLWFSKGKPLIHRKAFEGEYRNPEDPRIRERMERGLKPNGLDWMEMGQVRNTSREKRNHPCQVPEKMVERFILGTTKPGDLVGDCYSGSGTTGICAIRNGRNFAGCEVDQAYVDVALEAFEAEKTKGINSVPSVAPKVSAKGIPTLSERSESKRVEIRQAI